MRPPPLTPSDDLKEEEEGALQIQRCRCKMVNVPAVSFPQDASAGFALNITDRHVERSLNTADRIVVRSRSDLPAMFKEEPALAAQCQQEKRPECLRGSLIRALRPTRLSALNISSQRGGLEAQ